MITSIMVVDHGATAGVPSAAVTKAAGGHVATGTAGVIVLAPLFACADAMGVDVDALYVEAGIPVGARNDPDYRISEVTHAWAWTETAARCHDPILGLHVAEHAGVGAYDILDYSLWCSATLGEVLDRLARFYRIVCDSLAITLEVRGRTARLERVAEAHSPDAAECYWALIIRRARELTGRPVVPREVRFEHAAPRDVSPYSALFQCPVRFGCARTALVFDAVDLALAVRSAKPGLAAILDRQMEAVLARLPASASFTLHVRQAVGASLQSGGRPTLRSTARHLKASPRTVQRRLSEDGTTHREIVESVRRDLAQRLLEVRRMSITEIAFLLGFSDVSGFRRTFKRWTGRSPNLARAVAR